MARACSEGEPEQQGRHSARQDAALCCWGTHLAAALRAILRAEVRAFLAGRRQAQAAAQARIRPIARRSGVAWPRHVLGQQLAGRAGRAAARCVCIQTRCSNRREHVYTPCHRSERVCKLCCATQGRHKTAGNAHTETPCAPTCSPQPSTATSMATRSTLIFRARPGSIWLVGASSI